LEKAIGVFILSEQWNDPYVVQRASCITHSFPDPSGEEEENMAKIAVIIEDMFEDSEYTDPVRRRT
jgi:hypothetical protein